MSELTPSTIVSRSLSSLEETHDYHFDIEPGQIATISFVAPPLEYKLRHKCVAYLLPKPGPGVAHSPMLPASIALNAHEGSEIDANVVETHTFEAEEKSRVFIAVSSANEETVPSAGYQITLNLQEQ